MIAADGPPKPTADWERIGEGYYRKIQLYSDVFDEELELENYIIAGAPYSGALALVRDEDRVFAYRAGEAAKSSIDIYNCAGKLIRRINWDKGPIRGLGWSEDEKLIVVSQDGTVRCYLNLSDDFTPFTLGHVAEEHGVVSCRFWMSGFVALLGNNQLVSVTHYNTPRPKLLATPPSESISSWTVIPPAYTLSRSVEALLAIGQTINVVDTTDSEDRLLQNGPFRLVSVSPNGKFVALYTDDGKVWVVSSDFQEKLSEYDSRVKTLPKDMQWCGNDAVVLAWDDEVHLIGPNGAANKYYYDGWVHLIPDIDGVRIFTNEICEFLQKVPGDLKERQRLVLLLTPLQVKSENAFKLGSTSPSTVLLDAVEQYDKRSPKADDNLQFIKPRLIEAVDDCIEAAGHEFNIHWQKQLLKAASFGKTVLDLYDSDEFVEMSEILRILNAVRHYEIGLPLSYEQYRRLNPERLVQRLVSRQEYLLALRLSDYLRLPTDRIYVHWAVQKVRVSNEDGDTTCERIVSKLQGKPGISFYEIARAAQDEGRTRLATSLLNHEPRASKQVPLLLTMEEDTLALDKALLSGDTDLTLSVLLHLKTKLPLATFFRTINSRPVATALVEATSQQLDRPLLKDLYYQDDRRLDGANLLFLDALAHPDTASQVDHLRTAHKLAADIRDASVYARSIEDCQRLLRLQETLDADSSISRTTDPATDVTNSATPTTFTFTGLSLHQTIYHLIRLNHTKKALALRTDHKVTDVQFWHIRLRALIAARAWRDLQAIADNNKRSPIGWEIFFNEAIAAGNMRLAGVFVAKCTGVSVKQRAEMWEKCGMIGRAAEEAGKGREGEWLEGLRERVGGRDVIEVEKWLGVLAKGGK